MTETKKVEKIKKDRSTAYPAISLEQALEYSKMLVEAYRKNPFGRQNAVEGIGYQKITGDTAQKIGALGHYGLLEKSGKSAYRNSEIAQSICYFTDEDVRTANIQKVVMTPKLFGALLDTHAGQSLPAKLSNVLVQTHGITPTVANKVAEIFKESISYAGLLVNGIVNAPDNEFNEEPFSTEVGKENAGNASLNSKPPVKEAIKTSNGMVTLELPSGVVLLYPHTMSYKFATGSFAKEITSLNNAIELAFKESDNGNIPTAE